MPERAMLRLEISQEKVAAAREALDRALEQARLNTYAAIERQTTLADVIATLSPNLLWAACCASIPGVAEAAAAEQQRLVDAHRAWLDEQNRQWYLVHGTASTAGHWINWRQVHADRRRWYTGPRSIMARKIRRAFIHR